AREFAEALRAGAAGEDPVTASEAATQLADGEETAATRVVPRTNAGPREQATPVSPPRPSPPRRRPSSAPPRPVITPAAQQRRRKSSPGRGLRIFALLVVLALLAAAIIGLVTLANSNNGANASDSVRTNINDQISRLDEIIRGNTQ